MVSAPNSITVSPLPNLKTLFIIHQSNCRLWVSIPISFAILLFMYVIAKNPSTCIFYDLRASNPYLYLVKQRDRGLELSPLKDTDVIVIMILSNRLVHFYHLQVLVNEPDNTNYIMLTHGPLMHVNDIQSLHIIYRSVCQQWYKFWPFAIIKCLPNISYNLQLCTVLNCFQIKAKNRIAELVVCMPHQGELESSIVSK